MALQSSIGISTLLSKSDLFASDRRIEVGKVVGGGIWRRKRGGFVVCRSSDDGMKQGGGGGVPNSNYVVPLNMSFSFTNSSCITRRLAEILRDLNKRIPDNIISTIPPGNQSTLIP
ncbi:DNA repair RAD52-like protein 2, chloroplastic [Argentina anserina]|uniref:DNA repair RAD52-like protein 2, chloroplastic n=1 Tax=Argentina anserina TaxID=57926 RepID=UPI0021766808|nr:DNA repair RAD52-like protein 2, chloroplastic [Potentilla anserina]